MISIEDRIEHLREAIEEQQDQRDWLASLKWGESHAAVAQPILAEHDRIIAMYERLIVDTEAVDAQRITLRLTSEKEATDAT